LRLGGQASKKQASKAHTGEPQCLDQSSHSSLPVPWLAVEGCQAKEWTYAMTPWQVKLVLARGCCSTHPICTSGGGGWLRKNHTPARQVSDQWSPAVAQHLTVGHLGGVSAALQLPVCQPMTPPAAQLLHREWGVDDDPAASSCIATSLRNLCEPADLPHWQVRAATRVLQEAGVYKPRHEARTEPSNAAATCTTKS
jgi:hypothetical protein